MQDLDAIVSGQIQIEDDQVQLGFGRVLQLANDLKDFSAVGCHLQRHVDPVLFQGGANQIYIRRIVFRHQDLRHGAPILR